MPKVVKLTEPEIAHIVWALSHCADEVYYGPKEQYHKRVERIITKLEEPK